MGLCEASLLRPERTVVISKKCKEYVYLTQYVKYLPELKRSLPMRVLLGKIDDQTSFIPIKNYFELFGEFVELELKNEWVDYASRGPYLVVDKIVIAIICKEKSAQYLRYRENVKGWE